MTKYIFLFFNPGSAGNFLSRCLNLMHEDCYAWVDANSPVLNQDLQYKYQLLTYQKHNTHAYDTWLKFETSIGRVHQHFSPEQLPLNSLHIMLQHPSYDIFNKEILGPDDKKYCFYIDPSDRFEWCILNALYKNSYISDEWLVNGKRMMDDTDIVKIPLQNIIESPELLEIEIEKIANIVGVNFRLENRVIVKKLWQEWFATTLKAKEFESFKKKLGWNLQSS